MSALAQLQTNLQTRAVALAQIAADLTVQQTQAAASRRTGELAASITATPPVLAGSSVVTTISAAAPYALYQDVGTGVFGPSGRRIFPTTAKALRFDWPSAGGIVFAKSVAGAPGRHYFSEPMPTRWHDALATLAGSEAA